MPLDPNFTAPLDHFAEYAMATETDGYPKTDWTQMQFTGPIDYAAFSEAYDDAIDSIPVFSCRLEEKRNGLCYDSNWVAFRDVKNRLIIEDCRHLVTKPYDPMAFSTLFHSVRTRRRIDLEHEFPMTCYLLRVLDNTHIFSVVYHHSAMDPTKGYKLFTNMLAGYHERVTGKKPDWNQAVGMAGLAKAGKFIEPESKFTFIKDQLSDVLFRNTGGRVGLIANAKTEDYHVVKGRHSLRAVFDDFRIVESLLKRAEGNKATMNDLMFACVRKALAEWNTERDYSADRFRFMLITSMTGRMKQQSGVGARVSGLNFISEEPPKADIDSMMRNFAHIRTDQLRRGVDIHFNETMRTMVRGLRWLPLKKRCGLIGKLLGRINCTFYISNLGTVWPRFENGRPTADSIVTGAGDFVLDDITSSASIARNVGLGLHTRTHNSRFYMNFICDRFRFNWEEAVALRDRVVKEFENAAG